MRTENIYTIELQKLPAGYIALVSEFQLLNINKQRINPASLKTRGKRTVANNKKHLAYAT